MNNYNIYPKQFRNLRIPIEKNRCFILMPFRDDFDIIYGNIKKALHDNGYICNRADEIIGSKPILNTILTEILKSQYIIADLTGQNPNVFYELGIAHTFKDAQNIILITQNVSDIPFDIRHINNIIYAPTNLKYLTASIIQTLDEGKYLMDFYEALQQRSIVGIIHDNKEEFIDYLQQNLGELLQTASDILNGNLSELSNHEIEKYFGKLLEIIDFTFRLTDLRFLEGILKVLFESLVICSKHKITDSIVNDFLYGNLLNIYNSTKVEIISYQTDLAILLSTNKIKINLAMSWIIGYFSRSKTANIDLNRYKLERYLMVCDDEIINNIIIDSLLNENCYIREHMADIVGEKKLEGASETLIRQLEIEDNYFTALSIISAIGKLETKEGSKSIMRYVNNKSDDIIRTNQLFVLKHVHIALARLDKKYCTKYLSEFGNKYNKYLNNYFIL